MELTQELVKEAFDYHEDGYLIWKVSRRGLSKKGDIAGSRVPYRNKWRHVVCLRRKQCMLHRVIFLWHHGFMPEIVDHKDRDTENNKIANLREATPSQNQMNTSCRINSSSKYLGVYFHKASQKWMARVTINSKLTYLGCFGSEDEAALAFNIAAIKHYGEFANLNTIPAEALYRSDR